MSSLKRRDEEMVPNCPFASTRTAAPGSPVATPEMPAMKVLLLSLLPMRMVLDSTGAKCRTNGKPNVNVVVALNEGARSQPYGRVSVADGVGEEGVHTHCGVSVASSVACESA